MYAKTITLILCIGLSAFQKAEGAAFQYFTAYEYSSASQGHYLALGIRAKFQFIILELSDGIKKAQRSERGADKPSNGTLLGIHIYPFHGPDSRSRFVISATHLSDIFRGKPFTDRSEPVDHFFGAGYSILRNHYEIDLLYGKESHDCSLDRNCNYSNQFKATIRYIF